MYSLHMYYMSHVYTILILLLHLQCVFFACPSWTLFLITSVPVAWLDYVLCNCHQQEASQVFAGFHVNLSLHYRTC